MSDLAQVLSLEHEAVWTYGLIGGAFEGLRESAQAAFSAHRAERDRLLALVDEAVPPQAAYAPATYVWDLELVNGTDVTRFCYGVVGISPEATR